MNEKEQEKVKNILTQANSFCWKEAQMAWNERSTNSIYELKSYVLNWSKKKINCAQFNSSGELICRSVNSISYGLNFIRSQLYLFEHFRTLVCAYMLSTDGHLLSNHPVKAEPFSWPTRLNRSRAHTKPDFLVSEYRMGTGWTFGKMSGLLRVRAASGSGKVLFAHWSSDSLSPDIHKQRVSSQAPANLSIANGQITSAC